MAADGGHDAGAGGGGWLHEHGDGGGADPFPGGGDTESLCGQPTAAVASAATSSSHDA
jgi:hypothetical protein